MSDTAARDPARTAQDDLTFMRAIVQPGEGWVRRFGQAYFAAGVCYGVQMLLSAAQGAGWIPTAPPWGLLIGLGPTAVFLVLLGVILWRQRRAPPAGMMGKAVGAVFRCVGTANLALVLVIGSVAWRQHSLATWLIYPCAVLVLQGAAWMVVFTLQSKAWMALVAAGWFATAVAMAVCIDSLPYYVLWCGIGFLACMVVPGAVMMRTARGQA